MEIGAITINHNSVSITGNVSMTEYEIAELFGVTLPAVNNHIKAIYKCETLQESVTYQHIHLKNGNRADTYNLELITALGFRLNSLPPKVFWNWIIKKMVIPIRTEQSIVIQLKDNSILC